jgi:hypothetical protein
LSFSLVDKTATAGQAASATLSPFWTMVAESSSLIPGTSTTIQAYRTQVGDPSDPEVIARRRLVVEPAALS